MTNEERKILITGFMGAGKTTTAMFVARALGAGHLDLDAFIHERTAATAQQLIDNEGEMRFREIETLALGAALAERPEVVISLGGGTWTIGMNRALIAEHNGLVVWLDAPFELCWARIALTGRLRPFARDREKTRRLYADRRPLYQLANLRAAVAEHKRPERVAAEIVEMLRELEEERAHDAGLAAAPENDKV